MDEEMLGIDSGPLWMLQDRQIHFDLFGIPTTIAFPRGEPWLQITRAQLPQYRAYLEECRRRG